MSENTNKDNVVELSQSKTISEASPSLHRHENAIIKRDIIQDPGMPIDARMLLIYLVSFRPGWTFYDCKIRADLGIGFTKLKLLFKQLRDLGYVKTVPIIGDRGRMIGSKRMFSDFPEFQKTPTQAANSTESMVSRQSEPPTVRKSEAKIPNSNIKLDLNNNKKKYKKDFDEEFNEFWEQYPKKVDKHNAHEKYKKLLTTDYGLHAVILSALCIQNQQREIKSELGIWQAEPKGPHAWLNAKRWDDRDVKTREQLESECSKNKRNAGHGQYQQNGHGSGFVRPQSKIEARNSLVRRILEEDVANARRAFLGGDGSEGGGETKY